MQWLRGPKSDSSEFFWLHLSLSNAAAERWLHESLDLSEAFFESPRENTGSTRLELEGEGDALLGAPQATRLRPSRGGKVTEALARPKGR